MATIAIFSTYRPSEGFGGPARTYHQRIALERAGHRVIHVVVESNPDKAPMRSHDLVELCERPFRQQIDHIYGDLDLSRRAAADRRLVRRVTDHLRAERVDVIILEQPFLVDIVAEAIKSVPASVVYSCQNIEYRLRRDLERFQFVLDRPTDRADEVRQLERRAVELAANVTTICPTDQVAMRAEFGCDSVIVPNGTTVATAGGPIAPHIDGPVDFAFAGSSYWPNLEGFAMIAHPSLAFLPPIARIHVIGSACNDLLAVPAMRKWYSINASRLSLRGFLPMDELISTMRAARAVLVPVFIGEGSNLKSADALAAGVPVIMTRRATRGYEDVLEHDDEGVTVVDDAASFRLAMAAAYEAPRPTARVGVHRAANLSWSSRLAPLVTVIDGL